MSRYLFCSLFFVALTGCQLAGKKGTGGNLAGTWRLYDIEPAKEASSGASFAELASLKQVVQEGQMLSFFEDDKYTELKGADVYKTGNYQYQKERGVLQLADSNRPPSSASIEKGRNGKQVLSLRDDQQHLTLRFIREGERGDDFRESPFYPANNLWRVKPALPETRSQQLARLTNYIKHVALVLKASKESMQAVVSLSIRRDR